MDFDDGSYDLNNYTYYFFDMDDDESPELCITDNARFTYILKYDIDLNQFWLWKDINSYHIFLMGTTTLGYGGNARRAFFKIDRYRDYEYFLWTKAEGYTNSKTKEEEYCFLVTLPQYADEEKNFELTAEIREKAFFDEDQEIYYFRITEKQFDELMMKFETFMDWSREKRKEVTYTFDELFGEESNFKNKI